MISKVQLWWNSLPHPVQAAIMLFGGAAAGVVKHNFAEAHGCLTWLCVKGYTWSALQGGITAVVALYIPANLKR
jgi:hypothetical protein